MGTYNELDKININDLESLITALLKIKETCGNCDVIVSDNCGGSYNINSLILLKMDDTHLVEIS